MIDNYRPSDVASILDFADRYRVLLHKRTSEIVPAYFDVQRRVPINKIYVNPNFAIGDSSEWTHEGMLRQTAATVDIGGLLAASYRVVVLGDPGAGKSTLGQYLAHHLSDPKDGASSKFGIVPFIVSIRSFEEWKSRIHGTVADYITSYLYENFQISAPDRTLEYMLLSGRAFVIFDGLDELLDVSKRRDMCEVVANFADLYSTTTILVTSRRVGYYEAPLNPAQFQVVSLLSFSDDDVAAYVTNWFSVDDKLDRNEQRRIVAAFLQESMSVRDIRSNALMLGLMCNVYRGVRTIPRNRADLYEQCAEMLFERWDASRGISSARPLKADARSALQDIALWMFTSTELANGVPEKTIRRRLTEFWNRRYESLDRASGAARELLELWKGRTWILTDVGSSSKGDPQLVYKFTHQTFLEFFASVELVRRNPAPEKLWRSIRGHVMVGGWEIVAQLSIQRLDASYLDASDAILNLLVEDCDHVDVLARINLLSFAMRNLDGMSAQPSTQRALTRAAVDLAMTGMPSATMVTRSYDEYANETFDQFLNTVVSSAGSDRKAAIDELVSDDLLDSDDAFAPLLMLLRSPKGIRELVYDEVSRHLLNRLDDENWDLAAKAFVLSLSLDDLSTWADSESDDPYNAWRLQWDVSVILQRFSSKFGRQHIIELAKTNFWVAIVACRYGLLSTLSMVEIVGVVAAVCTMSPFGRTGAMASDGVSIVEELLRSSLGLAQRSCGTRKPLSTSEVDSTLTRIGQLFLEDPRPFDSTWMSKTDLYRDVVDVRLLTRTNEYGRDWEAEPPDEGNQPAEGPDAIDHRYLDILFGSAVLLAVVIEFEQWNITDHSEDQIASLRLGLLQPLEGLFVARCISGVPEQGFLGLTRLGLAAPQAKLLLDWATHRKDFTFHVDENIFVKPWLRS